MVNRRICQIKKVSGRLKHHPKDVKVLSDDGNWIRGDILYVQQQQQQKQQKLHRIVNWVKC